MKVTQVLYLAVFVGIVVCIVTSSHLEGYEDILPVNSQSEPTVAKSVSPTRLSIQAMPNASHPGTLPFGPYAQQASVGSYQYQDPAQLPATFQQISQLHENLRSFLAFEGDAISNSSDPSVQLPLTQLRADSKRLDEEMAVLKNNPGVQSSLTQQNTADIEGVLSFLQRKVRLFQTSGVINSESEEGFQSGSEHKNGKTRATQADLEKLQTKVYAAILTLSSSGTTDSVVQARIKNLQTMYSALTDMIKKLNNGTWTPLNIPVFQDDITTILPNLDNPSASISMPFSSETSDMMPPMYKGISKLVGKENAASVFNSIMEKGLLRMNVDLGYNLPGSGSKSKSTSTSGSDSMLKISRNIDMISGITDSNGMGHDVADMETSAPFDASMPGAEHNNSKVGGLDWKHRAESICEQVRLRGLDPQDFGCIAKGSMMSPAYSWRGHTKMICGRLGATMDPNLPVVSGCPPSHWAGWGAF